MYTQHEQTGDVVTEERRGRSGENMSDHDRLVQLEGRVERMEAVLYGFLGIFKTAFGHLWNWMSKNIRGSGGGDFE